MTNRTIELTEPLYHYLCKISLREDKILYDLREETAKLAYRNSQISPEQGQFMALLIELIGAKRIIEIGTFTGYSTLIMARALPQDGYMITCDINSTWTDIAQQFWKMANCHSKIDLQLAPALTTLDRLLTDNQTNTFDFAFIDADKVNYDNYYESCLRLIRQGGLIAIDNVLWSGRVADPTIQEKNTVALRQLNEKLLCDSRISLSLVPIGDGLMLARKR